MTTAAEERLAAVCDDLADEHGALDALLAGLPAADWACPTPAPGWDVRDQVAHIAYFDAAASRAVADPDGFAADRPVDRHGLAAVLDDATAWGRTLQPDALLAMWRTTRVAMITAFRATPPDERVPWYGPAMSPTSFATARLMETWAHGQDVADAVGMVRPPTARLRHIAHLGVLAFANSYRAHGREVPSAPVHVDLRSPDGRQWVWGDPTVEDCVAGDALDFALVVTQRRHVADTGLVVRGPVATEWMGIAQAFAGPPGPGRRPGQFPSTHRPIYQEQS